MKLNGKEDSKNWTCCETKTCFEEGSKQRYALCVGNILGICMEQSL